MIWRGFNTNDQEDISIIDEFKQKIIILLLSLLEGELNNEIIENMSMELDFNLLRDWLATVFLSFAKDTLKRPNLLIKNINLKAL